MIFFLINETDYKIYFFQLSSIYETDYKILKKSII